MSAKLLRIQSISSSESAQCVRSWHYSGRPYTKSQIHHGVFWEGRLCGVLAWGPSLDVHKSAGLVEGTVPQVGTMELNRMALSPALPPNSASRSLAVSVKLLKRERRGLEWLVSYADGCQCGDGTIYRAAGWLLTQVKPNTTLWRTPEGDIVSDVGIRTSDRLTARWGKGRQGWRDRGLVMLPGYQLRYMRFLTQDARDRYTGDVLPYSDARSADVERIEYDRKSVPHQLDLLRS